MANKPTEPEGREIRADARDVRADARDVRADVTDTELQDRGVRADVREDIVTERESTVIGSIRLLKWLVVVLVVISAGNFVRTFYNQDASEKAIIAAERVEKIAAQARDILVRFEEAANANDGPENEAVIEAVLAIIRLERFICDGPCPEVEE